MKPILLSLFILLSFQSFGQDNWKNLPQEEQALKALNQKDYPLAIQLYEKALEIRKAKYPEGIHANINTLKEVSKAMDHLIVAHNKAKKYKKHIELCKELSAWSEKGIDLFPDKTGPYLEYGFSQLRIAESHQALKQYDKGGKRCQNLIDYFAKSNKHKAFKVVANQMIPLAHGRAGDILKDQGDLKASVVQHEKSVAAWQSNLKGTTQKALVYEKIGRQAEICVQRFGKLEDSTNVIKYAEIALKQYKLLSKKEPRNEVFPTKIRNAESTLAIYKSTEGSYEEAIEHYKNSLDIDTKRFKKSGNPDDLKQMTAINLKISECYDALKNQAKSAEYLSTRVEQLEELQKRLPKNDYSYITSRNQYNLAKKYETLKEYPKALKTLEKSMLFGQTAIEKDPENTRRKEWPWIQEFFRFQLLREMGDYKEAGSSLEQLKNIFTKLEELESGIQYSEHLKEVETSQNELAYPDVVKLDMEIEGMEDGKSKFDKSMALVKLLKKKMKKDPSMQLSYVRHTSALAWTGLMTGEYKKSAKALKKAMKIKPVDPYLITNYAPCLLFLGKYEQAEAFYTKHYNDPFKPESKIIEGFMDDFEKFEEKGVIPKAHRAKADEIKAKLEAWKGK